MKHILGCMRRADDDFNMVQDHDRIAIGVSGGKDSVLMLHAFHLYRMFTHKNIYIHALMVDLGFEGFDPEPLQTLCQKLQIPLTIIKTGIGPLVFDTRKEKNPCALCAKMRKGAFYKAAQELQLNKAAFAHHREDVLETFLLSLFYEARINTFSPVTHLSRSGIILIRPFIYLSEKHIISAVKKLDLPVIKNSCPVCGNTKRQEMKELIKTLAKTYPKVQEMMLAALKNTKKYNLWDKVNGEDMD